MDAIDRENKNERFDKLEQLFTEEFHAEKLVKAIFSEKRKKSAPCSKVTLRPVKIGKDVLFQAERVFLKKVTHQNLTAPQAVSFCLDLVMEEFKQINIFTQEKEIQVLASKPASPRITTKKAGRTAPKVVSVEHNKKKNYIIEDGMPCDFLMRLGVMSADGKVFPRHYGKFRQINRYLEIVEDVFSYLPPDKTLKIIDFGCGKAYLTFALYYYLKVLKNRDVEIIGLDLKADVIKFCSQVAKDLHYTELKFLMGDIADYTDTSADMVVTLHACDTATDYALMHAVSWNTKVILSVPCCQHELFKQIHNELHQPMLKHGILKDRLTEYLTDGLRGLKLEAAGYDVAMIEFTSLEHTARNIMIKAVKSNAAGAYQKKKCHAAQQQYEALCQFYQVHPAIDQLPEAYADD